ncbi:hypothetical protein BTM240_12320 [Helicobacter pylori]
MFVIFAKGYSLAISLCAAVGAQSLFIVERGMARNYVFLNFAQTIMYHHLTNIIKVVLNPKILKYHFE